jgi:two-component system, NtrC family, sensor histidine kinase PilS
MSTQAAPPERRRTDRRRRSRETRAGESWFGAFVGDAETMAHDDSGRDALDLAVGDSNAAVAGALDADSALQPSGRALAGKSGPSAFRRIYRAFLSARATLGAALVATVSAAGLFGSPPGRAVAAISVAYAALALGMWLLAGPEPTEEAASAPRLSRMQWLSCIGADVLCFSALHVVSPGNSLNYAALLVLPVLMAGVLARRLQALAVVAVVALLLLGNAWLGVMGGGEPTGLITQAGLAGSGLFVITVLAGELASRLAREELTARDSLELARQQAQLNRLVIEEMQDGVLVVDRSGRVRATNPAARRLLVPRRRAVSIAWRGGVGRTGEDRRARLSRSGVARGRPRCGAAVRARGHPHLAGAHSIYPARRCTVVRGVVRVAARRRAQHASAYAPGQAGGDGSRIGRHCA